MGYVLLDARAHDDPDDAIVYVSCEDLAEALDYRRDFTDAVLAELHGEKLVVVPWPREKGGA